MSEHKTGRSNWTPEQKERYWRGKQQIASLSAQERRMMRRLLKAGRPVAPTAGAQ